jgi:hypothetical protein
LQNPAAGGKAIAAKFRNAGFETVELFNPGIIDFKRQMSSHC